MEKISSQDRLYPDEAAGFKAAFLRFLKGILVGIGAILPGLSGGVLSVIFGLYEPILDFFSYFRDRFWRRVVYLIPVGLGGLLGILLFSVFVSFAFQTYQVIFVCLFIGFVLGTLPSLWRTAGSEGRSTSDYVALVLAGVLVYLSLTMVSKAQVTTIPDGFLTWFISGAVIGLGMILPGLSPSNFLIYFGLYDRMTDGIKDLNFGIILPLALGGLICVILLSRVVNKLIEKHHSTIYHIIFGLVLGSTVAIIPQVILPGFSKANLQAMELSFGATLVLSLLALVVGALVSYAFSKLEDRVEAE